MTTSGYTPLGRFLSRFHLRLLWPTVGKRSKPRERERESKSAKIQIIIIITIIIIIIIIVHVYNDTPDR
ncbi:hypothetical protein EYF80_024763 [Liparis tanakae]|uniref:Uncharacterized protein n=1 Tax=Liparis tanakae TaxID=230148 RepID=A0A4Z2HJA8_9TELE|nr:hypothetical protein EYF80_024763 [Liparis tanakae]